MQLSLKNYLAIGLGICALGAFLLSRSQSPDQNSGVQPVSNQLEPLGFVAETPTLGDTTSNANSFEPVEVASKLEELEIMPPPVLDSGDEFFQLDQPETDLVTQENSDFGSELELVESGELEIDGFEMEPSSPELQTSTTELASNETSLDSNENSLDSNVNAITSAPMPAQPSLLQRVAKTRKSATWKQNPFFTEDSLASPEAIESATQEANQELTQFTQNMDMVTSQESVENKPALVYEMETESEVDMPPATLSGEQVNDTTNQLVQSEMPVAQSVQVSEAAIAAAVDRAMEAPIGNVTPLRMTISDTAAQQAVHHIEYGKSLARRGASFVARQEFLTAIRVVAEENDAISGSNVFSKALQSALMNLKEAQDFIGLNPEVAMDVDRIVASHRSGIVSQEAAKQMVSREAMKRYLNSAQQNLDMAGGRNVVASEALFNLGKLHRLISESNRTPRNADLYRAIVFHQTALMGNPQHSQSANELGVLLVRTGQLRDAKQMFKQSLKSQPSSLAWQNLAKAHNRLGEQQFANLASNESLIISNQPRLASNSEIQWMSNQKFNSSGPSDFDTRVVPKNDAPRPAVAELNEKSDASEREAKAETFGEKLKKLF